jgi:hypothetical protein
MVRSIRANNRSAHIIQVTDRISPDIACLDALHRLPAKFWRWFGDQEALRNVVNRGTHKIGCLPESIYACLVDVETDPTKKPQDLPLQGSSTQEIDAAMRGTGRPSRCT